MPEILRRLPNRIATYYEPFVGGGAVFFALAAAGRIERAVLGDTNEELMAAYVALRREPAKVVRILRGMRHSEGEYYRVRAASPKSLPERAARLIYLNHTGYNGLYRVNRAGEFNVPFGRYQNPRICDEENLLAVSRALEHVELVVGDFERLCARAEVGDAVYLDPPYVPLSATAKFKEYGSNPFGIEEHRRLARVFADLAARGVHAVLSNSWTEDTAALYAAHAPEAVPARRSINSNAHRRGHIKELLVVGGVSTARRAMRSGASPRSPARSRRRGATGNTP